MVSAIIFDCDGVLVDSEVLSHEVESRVLDAIGLHYDRAEFIARFMGMSNKEFFAALDADGQARLGRSIIDEVRAGIDGGMARAIAERLAEVPGARDAIASVRLAKAVASSSTVVQLDRKLKLVGHWDRFAPHIYSADHVARSKPAPDLSFMRRRCWTWNRPNVS